MSKVDEHSPPVEQISTGLNMLQKRQTKLSVMSLFTGSLLVISFVGIFVQQDFIYHYFGLTQSIEQLHLPYTLDRSITEYANQPDYLMNLLSWLGWFVLKVFVSIIGAFIAIKLLKFFRFFYVRFQSFILKFVAWLIAIIVIWSSLTYVQYDLSDDDAEAQFELVHYQNNIQESRIAELMNENQTAPEVKAYVLAQTALLHQPVDKDVATAYVAQLAQAERTQQNFIEFGFKPEQLWTMQKQVYGQSMTPLAKSVEAKVSQANNWSHIARWVLASLALIFLLITALLYALASRLKQRAVRIQQQIQS